MTCTSTRCFWTPLSSTYHTSSTQVGQSHTVEINDINQIERYKLDSYMLFIKLIKEGDFELRDAIINSVLNNLRFPNQITFYFIYLILMIFTDVENDMIHEQIVR